MMNHQRFEDAKNFTTEIEKKIEWISENFKVLPDYVTITLFPFFFK